MGIKAQLLLSTLQLLTGFGLLIIGNSVTNNVSETDFAAEYGLNTLNCTSFPSDFRWGAGSSAYQVEGGANEGGKGPSIWDTFSHEHPEHVRDHSNGDLASDSYHRYKEDVQILKNLNLNAYRFSISWARVLPRGKLSGGVNEEGISYYNNLINELLANGIEPYVTLFHWDVPQALEDEYDGFLSEKIVVDFCDYADLCFKRFGDRVKYWITLNEPLSFSGAGYVLGDMAPGRCSSWLKHNCSVGDSGTEPYIATHNQLIAHAVAVNKYRKKYQKSQKGEIGITLVSRWILPLTNSSLDVDASYRSLDFRFGWFMDPITTGDYPKSMRSLVGNRLPIFSPKQEKLVKGSFDFLGINYYTSQYATSASYDSSSNLNYDTDARVTLLNEKDGVPIGAQPSSSWIYVYPKGIRDLLLYISNKYNNPRMYVTENGLDQRDNLATPMPIKEALNDTLRIQYYHDHLYYILEAMKLGVKVEGYFAWSLIDSFEWGAGYTSRFGMYYTDYKDGQKRYPKLSTHWFRSFLQKPSLSGTKIIQKLRSNDSFKLI